MGHEYKILFMKVVIVGGSVSGLACAEQILALTEFEVTVVDKKRVIGENPRCAGGVSLYMVERVGVWVPDSCIAAKIRRVRIYAPNGNYWEMKGEGAYGYVLDRAGFEQAMAERVRGLGGKIVLGHLVSSEDLEFWQGKYDYIVGADGLVSVVRRWLGLPSFPPRDIHLGVQKTIVMDSYPQDMIEIYFGEEVAPEGYAWIFPAGDGLVRVGLGVPMWRGWRAHKLLDDFVRNQVGDHREVGSIAKQIPTARMPKTGVYGKVLLVGDALPSTDPATGGGIMQGIASGRAAGRAIAEGEPKKYDEYIRWLRKQNVQRYKLKNILYSFSDQDLNDLIWTMQGFKPKTMSIGKELRRAVIHLLLRKPRLLGKFFKCFR